MTRSPGATGPSAATALTPARRPDWTGPPLVRPPEPRDELRAAVRPNRTAAMARRPMASRPTASRPMARPRRPTASRPMARPAATASRPMARPALWPAALRPAALWPGPPYGQVRRPFGYQAVPRRPLRPAVGRVVATAAGHPHRLADTRSAEVRHHRRLLRRHRRRRHLLGRLGRRPHPDRHPFRRSRSRLLRHPQRRREGTDGRPDGLGHHRAGRGHRRCRRRSGRRSADRRSSIRAS